MSAASRAQARAGRAVSVAKTHKMISPVGGLNTKDSLAAMPETDAVIIDNLFCQPTWVELRNGKSLLATYTGIPYNLIPYAGLGVSQMFCSVGNAGTNSIFRVDNAGGGAVGAAVVGGAGGTIQTITNPYFEYAQYGTNAADVVYLVNGVDFPLLFDGAVWRQITTVSAPYALTGAAPSSLSQVAVYKQRLWFLQGGTFNIYYLPQNVFAGALTLLNIGSNFKLGGYIAAMITISVDNTAGTNDYMAFISTQGEVVMFQGYDPSAVATWSVAAHFRIGSPVGQGRSCWTKMGMDAAIICADGLILLSEAMLTDRSQNKLTLSDKIRYGVNQAIAAYGTNGGWQLQLYPAGNKLILNVPTTGNRLSSYQFVMQTLTGAWVTWGQIASPLNATCWENFNNQLYFASSGAVYQGDTGNTDNGAAITFNVEQAFSEMQFEGQKRWTQCQPTFIASGSLSVSMNLNVDYNSVQPSGSIPLSQNSSAIWNVSLWSTPTYWGDSQQIVNPWIGLEALGFAGALYMQGSCQSVTLKWMTTRFMFEPGGTFYGKDQ
jgi:hypothetical protein